MEIKNTSEFQDCISIHNELNQLIRTYNGRANQRNKKVLIYFEVAKSEDEKEKEKINLLFETLYRKSIEENYLWQYCPTKVFKFYFEQRYEKLLSDDIDISLKDFFKNELNNLFRNTGRQIRIIDTTIFESSKIVGDTESLLLPDKNERYIYKIDQSDGNEEMFVLADFINQNTFAIIKGTQNKKIEYLLNKYTEIITPAKVIPNHEPKVPEINVDYSDTTAVEKIVFLHQLGILDFLRSKSPFNASTNKLAEVISAFTGISQTTAQPYINPIISKDVVDKNNPLKEKNIAIVKQKLLKMGYLE